MRRALVLTQLGLLFIALLVPPPAQVAAQKLKNSSKTRVDRERLAAIPLKIRSFVDRGSIAGAVTLVESHGRLVSLEAVGYQDLESRKPMRVDTIFDVRSVTKPVTAIGIMILVEEGRIALSDPVEKYLPEFKATTRKPEGRSTPITIRHLLTHTSGLPTNRVPEIEDITIKRNRTLAEVVTLLAKQEPDFEPGTQYRYSSGFAALGRVIEVVSGQPYEKFIEERIFKPLSMRDSFFFPPVEKEGRLASVYRTENGKLKKWEEIETYRMRAKYPGPEFGMYSTASDLAVLCRMLMRGGTLNGRRILSKAAVELMTEAHTMNIRTAGTLQPVYYGLGVGVTVDPALSFPLSSVGSFGHNGAFGSMMWVDPKRELIRIFLMQTFGFGNEIDIFMAMAASAVDD